MAAEELLEVFFFPEEEVDCRVDFDLEPKLRELNLNKNAK